MKTKTYPQALSAATAYAMERDESIYLMGLGVSDCAGIFGSTLGLCERFPQRLIEPPVSEAAFTGAAIGSALVGMRPIVVFQRAEFALLAMDQIVNHAAKIRYMSGSRQFCPMVVRIIVGKGWGNGAQHSQSLQSLYAHIPGLRVVMPSCPYTGQGLLLNALEANDPTIFIEHRDIFKTSAQVPDAPASIPLRPRKVQSGKKSTVVAVSTMVQVAKERYPDSDIFDLVVLSPSPDISQIKESYATTGELVVMDTGWKDYGVVDHVVARIKGDKVTKVGLPPCPTPTGVTLEKAYYINYDADFKGPF